MAEPCSSVFQCLNTATTPSITLVTRAVACSLAMVPPDTDSAIISEIANSPVSAGTSGMPSHRYSEPSVKRTPPLTAL